MIRVGVCTVKTAIAAWNAACDARAAFHHAFELARTVTHVRVLAGVAIAAAVCFQRAAAVDHGGGCFGHSAGAAAHTVACPHHAHAMGHLVLT